MANLVSRHPLKNISKITSRKTYPEIITFRYMTNQEEHEEQEKNMKSNTKNTKTQHLINRDKVYIPDAGDAIKAIKLLIMKESHVFE